VIKGLFSALPNKRPHLPGRVLATVVLPSSVAGTFLECDVSPSLVSLLSPFSTSAVCCLSRRNLHGITRKKKREIHLYFIIRTDICDIFARYVFTYEGNDTIKADYSLDIWTRAAKIQMHIEGRECSEGVLDKRSFSREKSDCLFSFYQFSSFRSSPRFD